MKAVGDHTPEGFMRLALAEGRRGLGRTSPNPVVGCVIVKDGRVVARGHHAKAGAAHAEVVALRKARAAARGADVYVTLEPCAHTGRTGPCAAALVAAGVRKVFVGTLDVNPIVHGKGIKFLRKHGVEVEVGLLARECRAQNEAFFHYITHQRPWVIAKLAESLDGKVATATGESRFITCAKARREGHALRAAADGIMVGVGTVLADDPELSCRVRGGRDPIRIVVDSYARTPPSSKVIAVAVRSAAKTILVTTAAAPVRRRRALARAGAEVVICKERRGHVCLRSLLQELGRRELLSVLVEGGPTLLGAFFDAGLIDKLHAFIAPRIIGGRGALGAVGGRGVSRLIDSPLLHDVEIKSAGSDLWLCGYVKKSR